MVHRGLLRAEAANDGAAILLAEADLVQFAERTEADVLPLLTLLRDSEVEIDPAEITDAKTAFALAQASLLDGRWQRAALLGNLGLELAVAARDIGVVREAGANLAAFALSYDEVSLTQWYWPLLDDVGSRETAVSQLTSPICTGATGPIMAFGWCATCSPPAPAGKQALPACTRKSSPTWSEPTP